MRNYVFNSIDTSKMKGVKPLEKIKQAKVKKPKSIKIRTRPKYIFRNKRKLWRIPDNF